jgi:hypothetical protein
MKGRMSVTGARKVGGPVVLGAVALAKGAGTNDARRTPAGPAATAVARTGLTDDEALRPATTDPRSAGANRVHAANRHPRCPKSASALSRTKRASNRWRAKSK